MPKKKRGGVKPKNKPKAAKESKRGPAEESKQGSTGADARGSSDKKNAASGEGSFVKKIERGCEKALEVFADGIVDVLIFSEKPCKIFRRCIQKVNFITFFLFKAVMQCYTSVHFVHILVYLLASTGVRFQFPLEDANDFIINLRDYLAWDYKLFVLIVAIIFFVNDLINTGHHTNNHVEDICILLIAEIQILIFAPPPNDHSPSDLFGNYLHIALPIITAFRHFFEACYNYYNDVDDSLNFIPLLLFMQLVILVFCVFLIFLYETSKFLEEYLGLYCSADVIF